MSFSQICLLWGYKITTNHLNEMRPQLASYNCSVNIVHLLLFNYLYLHIIRHFSQFTTIYGINVTFVTSN